MNDQNVQRKPLIFLSHASEDKVKVRNLCKRLREDGFDPWLDEERLLPGQDWNLEQREYKRAMRYLEEKPEGTIYAIPVRLDDCELPNFIREIQWVDYPADYDRLLRSLRVRAGGPTTVQKPATPRVKKSTERRTTAKPAGGSVFHIQGNVHVAGNMIGGDQTNYYQNQQTIQIISPAQFMDELRKIREEIERLKSQPEIDKSLLRRMDLVQADIDDAIDEAAKEKPAAQRINSTLDSARETMDKLSGSIASAVNVGATLGNLALMAIKVFGG
jgi:hypothetical protein